MFGIVGGLLGGFFLGCTRLFCSRAKRLVGLYGGALLLMFFLEYYNLLSGARCAERAALHRAALHRAAWGWDWRATVWGAVLALPSPAPLASPSMPCPYRGVQVVHWARCSWGWWRPTHGSAARPAAAPLGLRSPSRPRVSERERAGRELGREGEGAGQGVYCSGEGVISASGLPACT